MKGVERYGCGGVGREERVSGGGRGVGSVGGKVRHYSTRESHLP